MNCCEIAMAKLTKSRLRAFREIGSKETANQLKRLPRTTKNHAGTRAVQSSKITRKTLRKKVYGKTPEDGQPNIEGG